jgi:flavin reductase (DIM6/NTAB) family NADH-FMN oxidoreductase RutF
VDVVQDWFCPLLDKTQVTMREFTDRENPSLHVVTVAAGDERDGCLVGFSTQCSISPERYLVCLSVLNHTYRIALRADALAVHSLGEAQLHLARHFGALSGDQVDKFEGISYDIGASGAPILSECASVLEARIVQRIPFGDHWGFLLAPLGAARGNRSGQLHIDAVDFDAGHPLREIDSEE